MEVISQRIAEVSMRRFDATAQMNGKYRQFRMLEYRHMLTPDAEGKTKAETMKTVANEDLNKAIDQYLGKGEQVPGQDSVAKLKEAWGRYLPKDQEFTALSRAGKSDEALALLHGPMREIYYEIDQLVTKLLKVNNEDIQAQMAQAKDFGDRTRGKVTTTILLGFLASLGVAFLITRYLTRSVTTIRTHLEQLDQVELPTLVKALHALEQGDLTASAQCELRAISVSSQDELGQLTQSYNGLVDQIQSVLASFGRSQSALSGLIAQVQGSAGTVATASEELVRETQRVGTSVADVRRTIQSIGLASEESAKGATEVAVQTVENTQAISQNESRLNDLSKQVQAVADQASASAKDAGQALDAAVAGTDVIRRSSGGMQRILAQTEQSQTAIRLLGESSQQIGSIVGTISEISAQTNLLALNAAIEAARAGEHGRGFAVVADEVRKLSEQTGKATNEIGALIQAVQTQTEQAIRRMDEGVSEVRAGASLSAEAGTALQSIQTTVQQLQTRTTDIARSAESMLEIAHDARTAIRQIASNAEHTSATSEELSACAEEVSASVNIVNDSATDQERSVQELVSYAEHLTRISQELSEVTAQFRIEPPTVNASAPLRRAA